MHLKRGGGYQYPLGKTDYILSEIEKGVGMKFKLKEIETKLEELCKNKLQASLRKKCFYSLMNR